MVWLLVLLPIALGLVLAVAAPRRQVGLAGAAALAAVLGVAAAAALERPASTLRWAGLLQLELSVAEVSRLLVVLVPAVALPIVAFAGGLYGDDPAVRRLVGLLVAFVGAMELLLVAADLLTLLIAWELVAAFSWALIAHHWREERPPLAALEAFLTVRFGAIGLFVAAGALLAGASSLSLAALPRLDGGALAVVAAGVLLAAAAKSAQLPFSSWLFAAMEGPSPVSALLHSATMVAAGAYVVIRLQPALSAVAWFGPAVMALGIAGALAGGLVALLQTDFKRALAASTTAQYGLMFIAVGAGWPGAATAQLVTHAFFKSLLFLAAGFALSIAGTGDLGRLRLGRPERALAVLTGIGALALAAVPPLGGAFSKDLVLAAAAARSSWVGAAVVGAGLLSALYAARLYVLSYGPALWPAGGHDVRDSRPLPSHIASSRIPPGAMDASAVRLGACAAEFGGCAADPPPASPRRLPQLAMGYLAAVTVALGVLGLPAVEHLLERLSGVSLAPTVGWQLAATIGSVVAAFVIVWALARRRILLTLGMQEGAQAALADWLGLPVVVHRGVAGSVLVVAGALRRFDDRVIDAGVWATAATGLRAAGRLLVFDDRIVDAAVWGVARSTWLTAVASRLWDDYVIDGAVEALAAANRWAGATVRRLQNGMVHDYYIVVAVGVVVTVVLALKA